MYIRTELQTQNVTLLLTPQLYCTIHLTHQNN